MLTVAVLMSISPRKLTFMAIKQNLNMSFVLKYCFFLNEKNKSRSYFSHVVLKAESISRMQAWYLWGK